MSKTFKIVVASSFVVGIFAGSIVTLAVLRKRGSSTELETAE